MPQKTVAKQSSSQVCCTYQIDIIFFLLGSVLKKAPSNSADKEKNKGGCSSARLFIVH